MSPPTLDAAALGAFAALLFLLFPLASLALDPELPTSTTETDADTSLPPIKNNPEAALTPSPGSTALNLPGDPAVMPAESKVESADDFWPQWRGPHLNGISPNGNPPTTWSEESNVRWKIQIPGRGNSTPIIWNDQVFVLTAINTDKRPPGSETSTPSSGPRRGPFGPGRRFRPFGGREGGRLFPLTPAVPQHTFQFVVLCIDRQTGALVWQQIAKEEVPHEGHHENNTYASASPVTDGERLYVSFGSRGVYCYSLQGEVLWSRDLGHMLSRRSFGEGASPTLSGNTLILNWDHEGQSFLVAFNKFSGETLWSSDRDEESTWSTPLPVTTNTGTQIVTNGHNAVRSYDLNSGELIWEAAGQTERPVASPVAGFDHVFVASGYRSSKLSAIQLGHTGELTGTDAISWEIDRNTPDIPSLLLSSNRLYFLARNSGMLTCVDAQTGSQFFGPERIGLYEVYASPVAAAGHIFIAGRNGETIVLKDDTALQVVASNSLDDHFNASPAIAGNDLFLRGRKHLYCLSEYPPGGFGKSLISEEDPSNQKPAETQSPPLPDISIPPTTPATAIDLEPPTSPPSPQAP
ncbi:MAG: PQQ-binding-like beta-propeller repeat protein [Verrucomicrobiota bacterium]